MALAKANVCLTFDFDAQSLWLGSFNTRSITKASQGDFGAHFGVPRILEVLERYDIRQTFYVPGHTADTYPDRVKEIAAAGHEIGCHGYCHESPLNLKDEQEEREMYEKSLAALDRVGVKPLGYSSPAWDLSVHSVKLLLEFGFEYDSSLMGSDFLPYRCRVGDTLSVDKGSTFGKEVDLVEVPPAWSLDDFPMFEFIWNPTYLAGLHTYEQALELWLGDFRYMVDHVPNGIFKLTMHPQVTGRGARMMVLERIIEVVKETPGAEFRRVCDVVSDWKKEHPFAG